PAFILSQDQTLNKSFFQARINEFVNLAFTVFVLGIRSLKFRRSGFLKAFSLEFSRLHCCLLIKVLVQGFCLALLSYFLATA
ncbi:MAG: hypothetical protein K5678_07085, partial [Acetatifactor sp.]|nr:hypothetical protein [Acetatifactor sp.]